MRLRVLGSDVIFVFSVSLATLSLLFCASGVQAAADLYWNPPAYGAGTWDTTNQKWSTDNATLDTIWNNANGDNAIFNGSAAYTVTVDAGGISVHNITNNVTADRLTIAGTGSTLTLTGSNPTIASNNEDMSISANIAGTNGLIKTGSYYLDLFGNNTYSGVTDIQVGAVVPQSDTAFGTSSVNIASGAGMHYWGTNNPRTLANNFTIAGTGNDSTGAISIHGGSLTINGTITLAGNTTLSAGNSWGQTLNFGNTVSAVTDANLILNLTGNSTRLHYITGSVTLGTGTLTKNLAGILRLTGNSNNWSALNITEGTVQIGNGDATGSLPSAGNIAITFTNYGSPDNWNGRLLFNTTNNIPISGIISGATATTWNTGSYAGGIELAATNTGTVTLSGTNTFSAPVTVNGGALRLTDNSSLGTTSNVITIGGGAAASRIELANNITSGNTITLGGRTAATASHLLNVSGNNTISGGVSLATGGDQYVIQSDADKLSLARSLTIPEVQLDLYTCRAAATVK